jgi:hypothetical protein
MRFDGGEGTQAALAAAGSEREFWLGRKGSASQILNKKRLNL